MFRKLISNLPFSPSLINQIGFYSRRLKKEQFTRSFGLLFTVIALLIQSITLISPAKATLAASGNDIIFGGGNKAEVQRAFSTGCDTRNRCDIQAIYGAYGITANNLANARQETIYSSVANNYWSIGRAPRGYGGEIQRHIPGGPTIWSRTLHGWAVNRNWSALRVETAQGTRWILTECGNIVTKASNPTPPTKPDMKLTKTVNKAMVNKGGTVTYTITAKNIGTGTAKNVLIYDNSPSGLDLLNTGLGSDPIKSTRRWETSKRFNVAPGQSYTYRINAKATQWGPVTLTNKACVDYFDSNIYNNCGTAQVQIPQGCPIPGKENLPKTDPSCKTNPGLKIVKKATDKDLRVGDVFDYTLVATNKGDVNLPKAVIRDQAPTELEFLQVKEPGAKTFTAVSNPRDYISKIFSLNKGSSVTVTIKARVIEVNPKAVVNTACVLSTGTGTTAGACGNETVVIKEVCATNPNLAKDSPSCQPPCTIPGKEGLPANSPDCKACEESKTTVDNKDISCLELHKKARNITQQIQNANGTTAKAGDTVEYTLSVTNKSKLARSDFVIEENMEDVLEYADILDASGATFTQNPVKMLTWQPITIKPNETVTRTVLIKVKSTIPATPASTSDPLSNDLKMVNVYGDSVQINLPQSPVKTIERTVTSLPSTGIGSNIAIGTILLFISSYFFFRSKLMVKELGLVKQQFNSGAAL